MNNDKNPIISKVELATSLIASSVFVMLINLDVFIRFISGQDTTSYNYFNERMSSLMQVPLDWISQYILTASVTTFILWGIVGIVCYTIVYFFIDVKGEISDTSNLDDQYVHPTGQNKSIYKNLLIKNVVLLFVTIILTVIIVSTALNVLVPYSSTNILLALYESSSVIQTLMYVFLAFISIAIIPLSLLVLFRIYHQLRIKISI